MSRLNQTATIPKQVIAGGPSLDSCGIMLPSLQEIDTSKSID